MTQYYSWLSPLDWQQARQNNHDRISSDDLLIKSPREAFGHYAFHMGKYPYGVAQAWQDDDNIQFAHTLTKAFIVTLAAANRLERRNFSLHDQLPSDVKEHRTLRQLTQAMAQRNPITLDRTGSLLHTAWHMATKWSYNFGKAAEDSDHLSGDFGSKATGAVTNACLDILRLAGKASIDLYQLAEAARTAREDGHFRRIIQPEWQPLPSYTCN
jgi:hypothetical protein